MIDTLKLSKGLRSASMTPEQSEAVAEALNAAQTDYLTKTVLELAIEKLKCELQRFILTSIILVAIAQILVIKVWH
jgi:hypothetical protein